MQSSSTVKLKWVLLANLANSTGAAILWPLTTMYVHNYLHQTLTVAGIVMFFMSCTMILGNYLGGWLFDNWKPHDISIIGAAVALIAVLLMIFFHGWPMFAILISFVSFGDGVCATLINSYSSGVNGYSQRYVFNIVYMAFNVGTVVGTLLVGVLFPMGIRLVLMATAVCYAVLTAVVVFHFNVNFAKVKASAKKRKVKKQRGKTHRLKVGLVRLICINLVTIYMSYALWESIMSVHITNMHIPFFYYSMLWTLNGLLVICGQPIVGKLAPYIKLSTQVITGLAVFALSFLLLINAHTLAAFTLSMVVLTLGDLTSLPGVPAWVSTLTSLDEAGHYQGLVSMTVSIGRAIGPLFGGFMIEAYSYNGLFIVSFVLMMLTLLFVIGQMVRIKKATKEN